MLIVNAVIRIPLEEFEFTYSRSSGPGGQNVNKVNTKATLRWQVVASPSLPESVRVRFLEQIGRRLTAEGDLIVTSQRFRDQARNVDDCLEKLKTMLLAAAVKPTPRRPSKPTRASRERRHEQKRVRSQRKQHRRRPSGDES